MMSDLLSAWVLTTGDTSQQTNTARLSGALDQARLSYHSQVEGRGEVRQEIINLIAGGEENVPGRHPGTVRLLQGIQEE